MGRDTITVTPEQRNRALAGILTQLETTDIAADYESLADALHSLNMWGFINNQAEVIASHNAWHLFYENLLINGENDVFD